MLRFFIIQSRLSTEPLTKTAGFCTIYKGTEHRTSSGTTLRLKKRIDMTDTVDIVRMVREIGISEDEIRAALGLPSKLEEELDAADTLEKVYRVYGRAIGGSAVERKAGGKLVQLIEQALDAANTVEEAIAVFRKAPCGSNVERKALEKAAQILEKEITAANTVE